jgi:putative membrane protein insertion efficiency factor
MQKISPVKNSTLLLLLFLSSVSFAQLSNSDKNLVTKKEFKDSTYSEYKPTYIFHDSNFLVKFNPISLTMGGLLFTYQKIVSPQISSNCPYEPSCSKYSFQLIKRYGIFKGVFVSSDRLTRCNRVSSGDFNWNDFNKQTGKLKESTERYSSKHYHY